MLLHSSSKESKPTFYHHNGKDKSQIDYFLVKESTVKAIHKSVIKDLEASNTSDHTCILLELNTNLSEKKFKTNNKTFIPRPKWKDCDVETYKSTVEEFVKNRDKNISTEKKIEQITNILHKAGSRSIPKYRQSRKPKTKGKGIWNYETN